MTLAGGAPAASAPAHAPIPRPWRFGRMAGFLYRQLGLSMGVARWYDYAFACLFTLLAMLVNYVFVDIRQRTPFPFFFAAVIGSGWLGGLWPAMLSIALSTAFALIYIVPRPIDSASNVLPVAIFAVTSGFIAWLSEKRVRFETVQKELLLREQQARKAAADRAAELDILNRELETRVRQRTAALSSMVKELEAFSYSVSHDLRAPLRSLDGFSQALLEDYEHALDEDGKQYLRRIRANSQKMGKLIDDLLQLSRVTRKELAHEEVDLSELAEEIVREWRSRDPERQVEVKIGPNMRVYGDPSLLRIALENLIANSWKFTRNRPHAQIEIGMVQHDGAPAYFVRDNGAGFDVRHAGKLFTAFQRLHHEYEFEGTGIGLATVQRVIRKHGGRVWAEGAVE